MESIKNHNNDHINGTRAKAQHFSHALCYFIYRAILQKYTFWSANTILAVLCPLNFSFKTPENIHFLELLSLKF